MFLFNLSLITSTNPYSPNQIPHVLSLSQPPQHQQHSHQLHSLSSTTTKNHALNEPDLEQLQQGLPTDSNPSPIISLSDYRQTHPPPLPVIVSSFNHHTPLIITTLDNPSAYTLVKKYLPLDQATAAGEIYSQSLAQVTNFVNFKISAKLQSAIALTSKTIHKQISSTIDLLTFALTHPFASKTNGLYTKHS
jgi:hypothetical protein